MPLTQEEALKIVKSGAPESLAAMIVRLDAERHDHCNALDESQRLLKSEGTVQMGEISYAMIPEASLNAVVRKINFEIQTQL